MALALALAILCAGVSPGEEAAVPAGVVAQRPVLVEVLGFADAQQDESVADLHRAALLDARRNAVIQAHAIVEVTASVEGMRLGETELRTHAVGYVEEIHVLEAGLMPDADPPLYRVRVRALVRPLVQPADTPGLAAAAGQSQPVIRLDVRADLEPEIVEAARIALEEGLQRCGLVILPAGKSGPVLLAEVEVSVAPGPGPAPTAIQWSLRLDGPVPEPPEAAGSIRGLSHSAESLWQPSEVWQRPAIMIAQDALLLWNSPRRTTVVFDGLREDQIRSVSRAFGKVGNVELAEDADRPVLSISLSLSGDSTRAVQAILHEAGLGEDFVLTQASLTRLTFRPRAALSAVEAEAGE